MGEFPPQDACFAPIPAPACLSLHTPGGDVYNGGDITDEHPIRDRRQGGAMEQAVKTIPILGVNWQTYTLLLAAAILVSGGVILWRTPPPRRACTLDTLLGGLFVGVIAARTLHVLLNWPYFADHTDEILRLAAGGLNEHGAFLGFLFGSLAVGQWRGVYAPALWDRLAWALPLLALAAWVGCGVMACAYGQEVQRLAEYPAWLVWEAQDVYGLLLPRFAVQRAGALLALVALLWTGVSQVAGWLAGRRLWLALVLLMSGQFVLSFLRADYALYAAGLRLDQWLDVTLAAYALVMLLTPVPADPAGRAPGRAASSPPG